MGQTNAIVDAIVAFKSHMLANMVVLLFCKLAQ